MRILFDHNTPAPLRYALMGHKVETAHELGWSRLTNGSLISAAESEGFDLLDQSIRYQQNFQSRTIAILVLTSNDWIRIRRVKEQIAVVATAMKVAEYREFLIKL